MANQNERRQLKLTETLVDVQPVGVVYNITRQTIEDFVFEYLTSTKGIDKLETVRADVRKHPQFGWVVDIYAFISPNSSQVLSKSMKVESIITQHMDSTGFKTSKQLQDALSKIAKDTRLIKTGKGNSPLAIRLDTYKVLALMLALDPYRHDLIITEVKTVKKGSFVATVIKQEQFPKSESTGDKYADFMRRLK